MPAATAHALLALWNRIRAVDDQPEYDAWHSLEHVPERVGLPGFVEARRYRAWDTPGAVPDYLTLYWLRSLEALATPAYRDVFTHPTRWSARMRGVLTDFQRVPAQRLGSAGNSQGLHLVAWHVDVPQAQAPALLARLASTLGAAVAAGQLLNADWAAAQPGDDFPIASLAPAASDDGPRSAFVVLLEHFDATALETARAALWPTLFEAHTRLLRPAPLYTCLTRVSQADLTPTAEGERQPARDDLLHRYSGA